MQYTAKILNTNIVCKQISCKRFFSTLNKNWQPIIGLEIHAQIKSASKLFSDASCGTLTSPPNKNVALFDAAIPGTLPVINRFCVDQTIKTGLALNAKINSYSIFDRKHYFYPDLPHGYQITQNHYPIVSDGFLKIELKDSSKEIRISRIQLETDSGKSFHTAHPQYSLIDLNRAGRALMEIVTEPDMRSSEEAATFLKKLQHLLRHIDTSEVNMEEGEMRCDVNVSIQKVGEKGFGTRCEVKNMNSIRNIQKAIEYEIKRQIGILESGGKIARETRFFNATIGETVVMRSKEDEVDYRFLPEPNLPPLLIAEERIQKVKSSLPVLPEGIKARIQKEYNISPYECEVILSSGVLNYFEKAAINRDGKEIAQWIINDLLGMANKRNISVEETIPPETLGEVIDLRDKGIISGSAARKTILAILNGDNRSPKQIIEEKGLLQFSDKAELTKLCNQVLSEFPKEVEQFKKGNFRMMKLFMGKVMQLTKGSANPILLDEIFKDLLK